MAAIFQRHSIFVDTVLSTGDYDGAIKIYGNKGLLAQVASIEGFGLDRDGFIAFVKRILLKDDVNLTTALKKYIPDIP